MLTMPRPTLQSLSYCLNWMTRTPNFCHPPNLRRWSTLRLLRCERTRALNCLFLGKFPFSFCLKWAFFCRDFAAGVVPLNLVPLFSLCIQVGGVGIDLLEDVDGSVRCGDLQPGSPAEKAGFQRGDTLVGCQQRNVAG